MMTNAGSKSLRVAIYARVSSDEQAQSGTIANQTDFATRYCQLHSLDVIEVYADEAVSGTTDPAQRPEGSRMLADAKAGRFDLILVYRIDRLARSLWHLLNTYQILESYGVDVRFMTEPLDTSTPVGRFVFQLLGSMAELERETIRERTSLGRSRAIAAGKAQGRSPFGYTTGVDGRLAPDPLEAPIVQEIFSLVARGVSLHGVARLLSERQVPRMTLGRGYRKEIKDRRWTASVLTDIVRNPVYWTGEWKLSRKDGELASVPAPVLIEQAVAIKVAQQVAENNRKAKRPHRAYMLSGLIRCECGFAAVASTGSSTNRSYYHCPSLKRPTRDRQRSCATRFVRADVLDAEIWRDLRRVAENPEELAAKIQGRLSESAEDVEAARRELSSVVSEYDALLARRLEAQHRADVGEITREELGAYLRSGSERVRLLERRKMELAEGLAQRQAEEAQIASVEAICQQLRELVDQAESNPEVRQKLARSLVKQVTLRTAEDGRTVVHVEYLIAGPSDQGPDGTEKGTGEKDTEGSEGLVDQDSKPNSLALVRGTPSESVWPSA